MAHFLHVLQPDCIKKRTLFFWAAIGPSFLALALSVILLRVSFSCWPLIAIAILGLVLTWFWDKKGFGLAVVSLLSWCLWQYPLFEEQGWYPFFSGSIALSWWLVALGQREIRVQVDKGKELLISQKHLEGQQEANEKQLLKLRNHIEEMDRFFQGKEQALYQEKKELAFLLSCAREQNDKALKEMERLERRVEGAEQEKQTWINKCEQLAAELADLQSKEHSLQVVLENVITELFAYKYAVPQEPKRPVNPVVLPDDEVLSQETLYRQLKEQLEEKSELLVRARKELFHREGQVILLQKENEDALKEPSSQELLLENQMRKMAEESADLEMQIIQLEELISSLLLARKAPRSRSKPRVKKKEALPDILQDAIDKTQQFSLLDEKIGEQ